MFGRKWRRKRRQKSKAVQCKRWPGSRGLLFLSFFRFLIFILERVKERVPGAEAEGER